MKPGAYDSREGLPNNGLHIEGIYVAINATATPVRLARINWVIGGIFRDFQFQNKDIRSRLQSSQSCVTPSAIFVFAFPERYQRDTCDLFYVLVSDWSRDHANETEKAREKAKSQKCLEKTWVYQYLYTRFQCYMQTSFDVAHIKMLHNGLLTKMSPMHVTLIYQ